MTVDRLAAVADLRTALATTEARIIRAVIWSQAAGTGAIIVAIGLATLGFWLKG